MPVSRLLLLLRKPRPFGLFSKALGHYFTRFWGSGSTLDEMVSIATLRAGTGMQAVHLELMLPRVSAQEPVFALSAHAQLSQGAYGFGQCNHVFLGE